MEANELNLTAKPFIRRWRLEFEDPPLKGELVINLLSII
jgi:hypothetical protein